MVPWYHHHGRVVPVSEEVQLKVRVPAELKQLVDADTRTNKDVVQSALWDHFGGRKKSALETKKQHKLDELRAIKASIESEEDDRDRVLQEINAIDSQLEKVNDHEEGYVNACDDLLDQLEAEEIRRLVPTLCEDVADTYTKQASEVWTDCVDRAAEQERPLYNTQFMTPQEAEATSLRERTLIADAWDGESL